MSYINRSGKCLVCSRVGIVYHHVKTRGSTGKPIDEDWNKMPLCVDHHTHGGDCVHRMGLISFANKFKSANDWLIKNGWEKCLMTGKWYHSQNNYI